MARTSRGTYRQAAQTAQSRVLAAQRELLAEEVPMRRYPHPIPTAPAATVTVTAEDSPAQTQILEQLACQSQLLVDLLGAVNSLTAALLARQQG